MNSQIVGCQGVSGQGAFLHFSDIFANSDSCLDNWEWDILISLIFCSLSFVFFLWYSSLKAFLAAIFNSKT